MLLAVSGGMLALILAEGGECANECPVLRVNVSLSESGCYTEIGRAGCAQWNATATLSRDARDADKDRGYCFHDGLFQEVFGAAVGAADDAVSGKLELPAADFARVALA